jgi:hypothetical protein
MYSLKSLPSFPTESPSADLSLRQPFVEDGVIAAVVRRQELSWQNLRYFGEDFAGRDDCPVPHADTHAWPARQVCGAFFTPAAESSVAEISPAPADTLPETETPSDVPVWNRSLAVASAAAILLSASLIGLWAAHSFAPKTSQDQTARKAQDAAMVSHVSAH